MHTMKQMSGFVALVNTERRVYISWATPTKARDCETNIRPSYKKPGQILDGNQIRW
jgi:hypothetical protein